MESTPPAPPARPARYGHLDADGVAAYWRQQALLRHGPGFSSSPSTPVSRAERYRPAAILDPQQRAAQDRAMALVRSWYADDTATWYTQPAAQLEVHARETRGGSIAQLK